MKTADHVRSAFLRYFEARGHRIVRSSSLVPESDPTLLFTNAGMNQFKDVFLGREKRDYTRAASSQKCVRAGGKHNDLENVGFTARHHTFFEMLGNFSFGDYFKKEAIAFGWDFLTGELGLTKDRLKVTVFRGEQGVPRDEQAHRIWQAHLPEERILELGMKDNFWAMGDTGPCGPCSEIHFHQGDSLPCPTESAGSECRGVECDCDRWLEVWNLVFMQYDRDASGRLTPLPAPCVDTGMGLERIAAVVQGRLSNYETDLFQPLIDAIAKRAEVAYGATADGDVSLRVVADHLRAATFLVADGVLPGNEGRGYVLRKIIRRALRHGKRLGLEGAFLSDLAGAVVARMSGAFPELNRQLPTVERVVRVEEERFGSTLKQALMVYEDMVRDLPPAGTLPGADAFRLYDTYGLALDFTEELAKERDLRVDRDGFERELQTQQERARQASKMGAVTGDPVYLSLIESATTQFVGYERLSLDDARVIAVLSGGVLADRLDEGAIGEIVLDRTPFYGESGGQVGDKGVIHADGSAADVRDCKIPVPGLYVHHVTVSSGRFQPGMVVSAEVDAEFRRGVMHHHTATHLLHAALRETLGPHVKQAGSLVTADRLRFDFSHYLGLTERELREVETRVNGEILRAARLRTQVMRREDALEGGALAFFGDKYGERVRVVEVPGFSKELCGGTHVSDTSEIGLFLLIDEQAISAGTRRVEAVAGAAAVARAREDLSILQALEIAAKLDRKALADEFVRLRDQLKAKEREVQALKLKLAVGSAATAADETTEVDGIEVWTPRFSDLDRKSHAAAVDEYRNRNRERAFALLSTSIQGEDVHVIAAVGSALVGRLKAPELLRRLGLRGGGRPDFAQGGGVRPSEIDSLRAKAVEAVRDILGGAGG